MVPAECLQRVLHFEIGDSGGSCFSCEDGDRQFLITAKHIFENANFPINCKIVIYTRIGVVEKEVNVYYHINKEVDIAVMELVDGQIMTRQFVNQSFLAKDLIWGQDVYFLGFPYNLCKDLVSTPTDNPIPFIKKATFSGMLKIGQQDLLLLDGINNHGFSGGPVCYRSIQNPKAPMAIAGVINSYRHRNSPVFDKNHNKTDYYVQENTGIVYATNISYAIEIIKNIQRGD